MPPATEAPEAERQQGLNAACARTLANRPDLAPRLEAVDAIALRGEADAAACLARFPLPETALCMRPDGAAGPWFDALEAVRAEALGARWLAGVASNLDRRAAPATAPEALARAWIYTLLRGHAAQCPPSWRRNLVALAARLDQPEDYARLARALSLRLAETAPATRLWEQRDDSSIVDSTGPDSAAPQEPAQADAEVQEEDQQEAGVAPPPLPEALAREYRIYTPRHDRVVQPLDLASPAELGRLRARLDGELLPYRRQVSRLANQLQRLLLARLRRHWSLDQDDGQLDPSRLARLVASPNRAQVFRVEEEALFRQTCVTLLLDNSGSMRGHPITVAALATDILARALERSGIKVEVLGYTTAGWQDNPVARAWESAGRPVEPGRLNALRHIVYKAMDTPWRRARRGLGLMLQEGLLKENIDGEALWWAAHRLVQRPEPRHLLIVISDGAPMDKTTLAANPRGYLDRHLHEVIAWIERNTDIELYAIGIGHHVGRYYRHAVQLRDVNELGTVLARRLGEWLG